MNTKTDEPTHEQIERRAYQIYLERGFHPDDPLGNWLAAERELTHLWEEENMTRPRSIAEAKRAAVA